MQVRKMQDPCLVAFGRRKICKIVSHLPLALCHFTQGKLGMKNINRFMFELLRRELLSVFAKRLTSDS